MKAEKFKTAARAWLTIILVSILALSLTTGCRGRKIRSELIRMAKILQETEPAANSVSDQIVHLQSYNKESGDELMENLKDIISQIDTITAPIKSAEFDTKEINDLKDLYLKSWESIRDAMELIIRAQTSQDKDFKATLGQRLAAKLTVYDQAGKQFVEDYKKLRDKYGVTDQDIGVTAQPVPPPPISNGPLPEPAPFTR